MTFWIIFTEFSVFSIILIIYSIRKEKIKLSNMVKGSRSVKVNVVRNGSFTEIEARDLWTVLFLAILGLIESRISFLIGDSQVLVRGSLIKANQLVPGDVIEVENEFLVPADCVLISGEVLVDEAMLTGEATAMTKTSMIASSEPFDVDGERLHVLYGGTKVLLTRIPNGLCKAGIQEPFSLETERFQELLGSGT